MRQNMWTFAKKTERLSILQFKFVCQIVNMSHSDNKHNWKIARRSVTSSIFAQSVCFWNVSRCDVRVNFDFLCVVGGARLLQLPDTPLYVSRQRSRLLRMLPPEC